MNMEIQMNRLGRTVGNFLMKKKIKIIFEDIEKQNLKCWHSNAENMESYSYMEKKKRKYVKTLREIIINILGKNYVCLRIMSLPIITFWKK